MSIYVSLLWLFAPLAANAVLMTLEMPLVNAVLGRLPNANLALAALAVAIALDVLVEHPMYSMLQIGNALAANGAAFRRLCRYTFVFGSGLLLTGVLVAGTPLYDAVIFGLLGAPAPVAELARPAYWFMVLIPLAIGWRRIWQGAIILQGQAGAVVFASVIRLLVAGAGCAAVLLIGGPDGAAMGSAVLVAAIIAETLYVWWIGRRIYVPPGPSAGRDTAFRTYGAIWRLHAPLILAAFLMTLVRPITNAVLARADDPIVNLAAWSIMLSVAGPITLAMTTVQQVWITKAREGVTFVQVRRFAVGVGLFGSGLLALAGVPGARAVLERAMGVEPAVGEVVIAGLLASIPMALGRALQSVYQGQAVLDGRTDDVRASTLVNLIVLVVTLVPLVLLLPSAVVASAIASVLALAAETAALHRRWRRRQLVAPAPVAG